MGLTERATVLLSEKREDLGESRAVEEAMKKYDISLALTLFACLGFAFIALQTIPSIPGTPPEHGIFSGLKVTDIALTLFTAGALIVAVLQYLIYCNMRRDSIIKDRAFVFIRENQWRWLYDPKNVERVIGWKVRPILENSGNTKARLSVTSVSFLLNEGQLPFSFDFPDFSEESPEDRFNFDLAPHATAIGPECEFSVTHLVAVKKGYFRLYVWGWLEYFDVFEDTEIRRFEFCNEVLVDGDPRSKDCVFSMRFLRWHNGEDKNGYRKPGQRAERRPKPSVAIPITSEDYSDFGLTDEEWAKALAASLAGQTQGAPPT